VYDFFDVNVEAPRRVHIAISGDDNQLCRQIESAIRDCARSDSAYVRDIHWVPLATSAASAKDDWFTETLSQFDSDHVQRFWKKALERKDSDHDGAITMVRSRRLGRCLNPFANIFSMPAGLRTIQKTICRTSFMQPLNACPLHQISKRINCCGGCSVTANRSSTR
jgi:hypothetical protein